MIDWWISVYRVVVGIDGVWENVISIHVLHTAYGNNEHRKARSRIDRFKSIVQTRASRINRNYIGSVFILISSYVRRAPSNENFIRSGEIFPSNNKHCYCYSRTKCLRGYCGRGRSKFQVTRRTGAYHREVAILKWNVQRRVPLYLLGKLLPGSVPGVDATGTAGNTRRRASLRFLVFWTPHWIQMPDLHLGRRRGRSLQEFWSRVPQRYFLGVD